MAKRTKEELAKARKEKADFYREERRKFPPAMFHQRQNGASIVVSLSTEDRGCLAVTYRVADVQARFEFDLSEDLAGLARFIRALTLRYNHIIEGLNAVAVVPPLAVAAPIPAAKEHCQ